MQKKSSICISNKAYFKRGMHVLDDLYVGIVVGLILSAEHLFLTEDQDHGAFNAFLVWLVIGFRTGFNVSDLVCIGVCSVASYAFGRHSFAAFHFVARNVYSLIPKGNVRDSSVEAVQNSKLEVVRRDVINRSFAAFHRTSNHGHCIRHRQKPFPYTDSILNLKP